MDTDHGLANLLKTLLSLPEDSPTFWSPSFRSWVGKVGHSRWPPSADGTPGLWLVDTRDRVARRYGRHWQTGAASGACAAALILAGSPSPSSLTRRMLRRVRGRGPSRLAPDLVKAGFPHRSDGPVVTRLAFENGFDVPTEFELGTGGSRGTAFLVTRRPPFEGALWSRIGRGLGEAEFEIRGFALRSRGAAVLRTRARGREFVVRVIPRGSLQDVVRRNHLAVERLRSHLAQSPWLLERMPMPVFTDEDGSTLLLGETHLPGILAWRVAGGSLGGVIHARALEYLAELQQASTRPDHLEAGEIEDLMSQEQVRLAGASFVGEPVRIPVTLELERAAKTLAPLKTTAHISHGDFGYGNILVDPRSGELTGVIDWDTARSLDFPGIDRVNLEIQIRRSLARESFPQAVRSVWRLGLARDTLAGPGGNERVRALFGLAVSRYVLRSLSYPDLYREESEGFGRALTWLMRLEPSADR